MLGNLSIPNGRAIGERAFFRMVAQAACDLLAVAAIVGGRRFGGAGLVAAAG